MKLVLDVCCGGKMFHFNRQNPRVIFADKRCEKTTFTDRNKQRSLDINPDIQLDFTALPFADNSFSVVIFDPPHLIQAGDKSWLAKKYGKLGHDWKQDLKDGFSECFRVLKSDGVLIFKWNETQIKVSEILALTPHQPLVGHISGKRMNTHWITFLKEYENVSI